MANPPGVNMISPKDRSLHQALTSRVGMTFTDQIDLRSVNESSFIVRPVGSSAALKGKYSSQTGIVNFSPDVPLLPNTAYEVILPANGIRDLAGNALATTFRSAFSTEKKSAKCMQRRFKLIKRGMGALNETCEAWLRLDFAEPVTSEHVNASQFE